MMKKNEMLENMINYYSKGIKSQFASKLGIKPQTINSWLSRQTFDVELIYSKCENISADWLLSGKGDMLVADKSSASSKPVSFHHNQVNGDGAHGNINGDASAEAAVLRERVRAMQKLLDEKERLIRVLMEKA